MTAEDFLDLVRKRRNIRKFKPDPIPDEYVDIMLEAARWSMSGANGQPCEYVVVKDTETRAQIGEILTLQRKRAHVIEQTRVPELRHPGASRDVEGAPGFKDAPVIIVVCGDLRSYQATVLTTHFYPSEGDTFHMNIGNATQNIHLAAAALGLGAQWVSTGLIAEEKLKRLLGIPESFRIFVIVPVGYPAYKPPKSYRRELRDIVHHDRYEPAKARSAADVIDFIKDLRRRTTASYARY